MQRPEVRIFVSYSHKDAAAQDKLQTHLAPLKRDGVSVWYDGDMLAGDALDRNIARELRRAHIFVALLSSDYLASRYCWNIEYRRAENRRKLGTIRLIAAVVRPCDWKRTSAANFKLLPKEGRAVTDWRSADHAFLDIAGGISEVVRSVRKQLAVQAAAPPNKPPAKEAARRQPPASRKERPELTKQARPKKRK